MEGPSADKDQDIIELVSFSVGGQLVGIDIQSVREIRGWSEETAIPRSPDFVRGFINLRGTVVPIVDVAARLEMEATEPTARNVVVVVNIGEQVVGLLVQSVSDIVSIPVTEVRDTPDVASDFAKKFIRGVLPQDDQMLSILLIKDMLPIDLEEAA
ncbi:MAG: chemotaxis protein CheW [Pseudomonadota bacterium]